MASQSSYAATAATSGGNNDWVGTPNSTGEPEELGVPSASALTLTSNARATDWIYWGGFSAILTGETIVDGIEITIRIGDSSDAFINELKLIPNTASPDFSSPITVSRNLDPISPGGSNPNYVYNLDNDEVFGGPNNTLGLADAKTFLLGDFGVGINMIGGSDSGSVVFLDSIQFTIYTSTPSVEEIGGTGTDSSSVFAGGNKLKSYKLDNYNIYRPYMTGVDKNSFTLSNKKLRLNGIPLSLYENGNGKYCIGIYTIDASENNLFTWSDFSFNGENIFVYKGTNYTYLTDSQGRNVWYFKQHTGFNHDDRADPQNHIVWNGIPLSICQANTLYIYDVNGDFGENRVEETGIINIGGHNLTAIKLNGHWFLTAILDDSNPIL